MQFIYLTEIKSLWYYKLLKLLFYVPVEGGKENQQQSAAKC